MRFLPGSPFPWSALLLASAIAMGCRGGAPVPQAADQTALARRALQDFGSRLASVYQQNAEARRKAAADSTQEEVRFWAPSDAVLETLFSQAAKSQGLTAEHLREVIDADPELRQLQARVIQDVILGDLSDAGVIESAGARQH